MKNLSMKAIIHSSLAFAVILVIITTAAINRPNLKSLAKAYASSDKTTKSAVQSTGTLGTVVSEGATCADIEPGLLTNIDPAYGTTCERIVITCAGSNPLTVDLRITPGAAGQPHSGKTVILGSDGSGTTAWEKAANKGATYEAVTIGEITDLADLGFTVVDRHYVLGGWLNGIADDPNAGMGHAACHYSTMLQYVYDNYHNAADPNEALCVAGISGGAGEVMYALAWYGHDDKVDMALPGSGPPFGRIDLNCDDAYDAGCLTGVGSCDPGIGPDPVNFPNYLNDATPTVTNSCRYYVEDFVTLSGNHTGISWLNGASQTDDPWAQCLYHTGEFGGTNGKKIVQQAWGKNDTNGPCSAANLDVAELRDESVWSSDPNVDLDHPGVKIRNVWGSNNGDNAPGAGLPYIQELVNRGNDVEIHEVVNGGHLWQIQAAGRTLLVDLMVNSCYSSGGVNDPFVSNIADQTVTDGNSFADINLDDFVNDPDHADSDITWTTSGGTNVTVSIDLNRVASITYTSGWTGSETITFTATDPDGNSDSDGATFTVNAVGGNAPAVSDIPDQQVDPGGSFSIITLDNYVADPDHADSDITWSASGQVNMTVQIRNSNVRLARVTYPTGFEGNETITFTATDPDGNTGSDAATFTVGAAGGGTGPVVSDILNQTIDEGNSFANINLDDFVDDPDHADTDITWTTSGGTDVTVSIDANRVASISYTSGWTGSETITFTATDPDGNSDSDNATFAVNTVGGGGNAPVVSDIPDMDISSGSVIISMDQYVDDPDHADSEITWSWSGNTELLVAYRSSSQQIRVRTPNTGWTGSETLTFTATDPDGNSDSDTAIFSAVGGATFTSETGLGDPSVLGGEQIPEEMVLQQNYPNPFNPTTNIRYGLSKSSWVTVKIYNTVGQEIRTLVNQYQSAGYKDVVWNGRDNSGDQVSSGIYLYKLEAKNFVATKRLVLMK